MADKIKAGGALLADSEEFLTGKDGTFSGTVSASDFHLTGGLDAGLPYPTGTVCGGNKHPHLNWLVTL